MTVLPGPTLAEGILPLIAVAIVEDIDGVQVRRPQRVCDADDEPWYPQRKLCDNDVRRSR